MHITSLPSEYGIGDLGPAAYEFAQSLKEAGATLWQMLPLGPTGYGNSPYAQRSVFAGNEMLISPALLRMDGLLSDNDIFSRPEFPSDHVSYEAVSEWKMPILRKAAQKLLRRAKAKAAIEEFREKESFWIEDYALFMALAEKHRDARWMLWPDRSREPKALEKTRAKHRKEAEIHIALQYIFSQQMKALREHTAALGIRIIGDVPIFAGGDSADAWSHPELFRTDQSGRFSKVAGVPPDIFSSTGQLWGNPVYEWKNHKATGFQWWKERIRRTLSMADMIRIDHFRGLSAYYEINADARTAEHGIWKKSPGKELLQALFSEFRGLDLIAEDLGWLTDDVKSLRDSFGIPGMKIAQAGFTRDSKGYLNTYDDFLPHNYTRRFVAYTGTHDNNTVKGWYSHLSDLEKHMAREYLSSPDDDIVWSMIRALMLSNADTVIIPMQDVLEKGEEARMNYPSSCGPSNWAWRMQKGEFDIYRASRFSFLSRISGRNGLTAEEYSRQ